MFGGIMRRVTVTVVTAALVFGAGWAVLTWALPRYRPVLHDGERLGIDVSAHQGAIDWTAVATDDITAAYIKATEGATFVDDRFADNWTRAREVGVEVGAYHFFTLCAKGGEQAANLLDQLDAVDAGPDALPPVVDLELSGNCSARPAPDIVAAQLNEFVTAVEGKTGQRVRLYALESWTHLYPVPEGLADRERWSRRLFLRPAAEGWTWWQASNRAQVDGIDGPVDLNVVATSPTTQHDATACRELYRRWSEPRRRGRLLGGFLAGGRRQ
jgi:lysozyme